MRIKPSLTVVLASRLAHLRGFALRAAKKPGQRFAVTLKPLPEKKDERRT